ncbi:SGNH/GDSL hydrolase family protein [Stigmatella aurantiaca]|uniref:SGNH/GDSL hydrolase family protein n=1 Tax=Stigmatella aurantiaca TaxID=41 RepID=UPI000309376C|nr:SGNH/GDSL hydrolase family protein [Stigmatella aurantiaca]
MLALLVIAGCGAHSQVVRDYESNVDGSLIADDSGIGWEVVDRFRLVSEPQGTEKLFNRFVSYYGTVSSQINNEGMLETQWDAAAGRYRDGYLAVAKWKVKLSFNDAGMCEWRVGAYAPTLAPCRSFVVEVPKGETMVEVRLGGSNGVIRRTVLRPRDVLIASLGDSYASGEGVPDLRQYGGWLFWKWADAKWMDARCRRSLFSAPGLAALMYAKINPHVSVTHLTYACSGAKMSEGLLEEYEGASPPESAAALRPQVDEFIGDLEKAGRTPDYLTISAGGNDIGFADIVTAAATGSVDDVKKVVKRSVRCGVMSVAEDALTLKAKLDSSRFIRGQTQILLTEYPNPTNLWRLPENSVGIVGTKEEFKEDCAPSKGKINFVPSAWVLGMVMQISREELREINEKVAAPLSDMTTRLADAVGARRVSGIDEEFRLHGYCAPGLFTPNGIVRWVNTVRDSSRMMGLVKLSGAMHPNIRGQAAIARHILEKIRSAECADGKIEEGTPVRAKLCQGDSWRAELPGFGPGPEPLPASKQFPN